MRGLLLNFFHGCLKRFFDSWHLFSVSGDRWYGFKNYYYSQVAKLCTFYCLRLNPFSLNLDTLLYSAFSNPFFVQTQGVSNFCVQKWFQSSVALTNTSLLIITWNIRLDACWWFYTSATYWLIWQFQATN